MNTEKEEEIIKVRKILCEDHTEEIARNCFRLNFKVLPSTKEWLERSGYIVRYVEDHGTVIGIQHRPLNIPL